VFLQSRGPQIHEYTLQMNNADHANTATAQVCANPFF
jgi:hypothetical protein